MKAVKTTIEMIMGIIMILGMVFAIGYWFWYATGLGHIVDLTLFR